MQCILALTLSLPAVIRPFAVIHPRTVTRPFLVTRPFTVDPSLGMHPFLPPNRCRSRHALYLV